MHFWSKFLNQICKSGSQFDNVSYHMSNLNKTGWHFSLSLVNPAIGGVVTDSQRPNKATEVLIETLWGN